MTFGAEVWGPPLISAIGTIGSGFLSSMGNKETKIQKQKRKLVDELIASLSQGGGQFSDLFNTDEGAFQKSFVDPAKSMFQNQIAPQIQQQFIAGGQQRGTGLDDQLLRAGVDLDQLLNSQYMDFVNQGKNRQQNTISNILGAPEGVAQNTTGQNVAQATGGYLASNSFRDMLAQFAKQSQPSPMNQGASAYEPPQRKGFQADWSSPLTNRNRGYQ